MSKSKRPKIICIFGSYAPASGEDLYARAYEIGYALAKADFVVANGGYGGTMEAGAKGAKDAGGRTIGITCSVFARSPDKKPEPNPYIDQEIHHADPMARIRQMMAISSGYIVLPGGTGTLTEFSLVWEYVCKRLIGPRPILFVGDFWRPAVDPILADRPGHGKHLYFVETADQIVRILADHAPRIRTCPKALTQPLPALNAKPDTGVLFEDLADETCG